MVECETCGSDVVSVWKHRVRDACMTHRRVRRVCTDCHPFLSDAVPVESESTVSDEAVVTDGGTSADVCPGCSSPTINGQGLYSCVECGWVGRR